MALIWGRNPVVEALRAGKSVEHLYLATGLRPSPTVEEIERRARSLRVQVRYLDRRALDRLADGANHQGVVAEVEEHEYVELDAVLRAVEASGETPFLLLLDSLQDPQNLGSLIRTAEAIGVQAVVIPRHRSVGVTAAVVKASAGAIEHLPVVRETNLAQTVERLKSKGIWAVGLDASGRMAYDEPDYSGPLALVVGAEGSGLHRLVAERCDVVVRLPMRGKVASLNAAAAGSIVLYHAWRCRERARATS